MKNIDVRDLILKRYSTFNRQEKKVAETALNLPEQMVYWSIQEAAKQSGVSDSTVFRFCSKLGFDGFQSFKISLARSLPPTNHSLEPMTKEDEVFVLMRKAIKSLEKSLSETSQVNSTQTLHALIDDLAQSKELWIFGFGEEKSLAREAEDILHALDLRVTSFSQLEKMAKMAASSEKDTIVFLFSKRNRRKNILPLIELLKQKGVKTVAFTPDRNFQYAQAADVQIVCVEEDHHFNMNYKYSVLFIIDLIHYKLYFSREDSSNIRKKVEEEAILRILQEE